MEWNMENTEQLYTSSCSVSGMPRLANTDVVSRGQTLFRTEGGIGSGHARLTQMRVVFFLAPPSNAKYGE